MRWREPVLVGVLVFLGMWIAEALGGALEEAATAGITAAAIVFVFHTSKKGRKIEAKDQESSGEAATRIAGGARKRLD